MSDDEKCTPESNEPLQMESIMLEEALLGDAEVQLSKLSLQGGTKDDKPICPAKTSPLVQETVWLKQHQYESAETLYHMCLAGTTDHSTKAAPGKRVHVQDDRARVKKQKHDQKITSEQWNKNYQAAHTSLIKTVKTIQGKLGDLEKTQQRKAQVIIDAMARLTSAIDECQTKLNNELTQGAAHLHLFRSVLSDAETVIDKACDNIAEQAGDGANSYGKYYQKMTSHLLKLNQDLNYCVGLCDCSQADVSKSDINRIVGEIGKLTLMKRHWENDRFLKKKNVIANNITFLLAAEREEDGSSGSESSLEGSCSSEGNENGYAGTKKAQSDKARKLAQNNRQAVAKSNKNNTNATKLRKKTKTSSTPSRPRSAQNYSSAPMKRNAQGIQSAPQKREDLFQFRGVPLVSAVPFLSQPGLLGPRPNVLRFQGAGSQTPFRFAQYATGVQKQQAAHPNFNSLSQGNRPGFGNMNFNFSNTQSHSPSFDFIQNTPFTSMNLHPSMSSHNSRGNISSQMKQTKLYQRKQDPKEVKKSDHQFGFSYPQPQNPRGPVYAQNPKVGLMGGHPFHGLDHGNIEQQLNEMSHKIRQMQHLTSQNFQLQQLMRETERLKQVVAQKHNQHQDHFQYQFQLLINAFMQQQQQQLSQGPQSKMARSVHFQNQKQQQHHQLFRQQQNKFKKQKEQQKKVQQVKPEPKQQKSPKEAKPQQAVKQETTYEKNHEASLQNGDSFTLMAHKQAINKNSRVIQVGTFNPDAQGDKRRAGVSSIVVIESFGCVVVVDIINGCLKLYNVTTNVAAAGPNALTHNLVTRLELPRPYYMSQLSRDMIVVSREGKLLSLIRVSKKRLEFLHDIRTETQYYGLGYVRDNVVVCAAFGDNRIDILSIQDGVAQTATLVTKCKGPELVASVPSTGYILYLERVINESVRLLGVSQQSIVEFSVDLESSPSDVWSIVAIGDRIVCANKQNGKVKLFTDRGVFLTDVIFPAGAVNQPFAMAFSDSGYMYIANDGAWDNDFEHYITTDINVYAFS